MITKDALDAVRKCSRTEAALVDRYVQRFIKANRRLGMTPSETELNRTYIEASEMVRNGQITEADFKAEKLESQEFRCYRQYETPKDAGISR